MTRREVVDVQAAGGSGLNVMRVGYRYFYRCSRREAGLAQLQQFYITSNSTYR